MSKQLPKTRFHLQKLTQRINRLEKATPYSKPYRGTGVRAMAAEVEGRRRINRRIDELKIERRLVEIGLIEILERGEEISFALTKKGCIQALKDRILLQENYSFDNEKCIIVFDFPEDIRQARNTFRRFLKDVGFIQVQLSVWMSEKYIEKEMKQLIQELEITDWVKVLVGKEV